MSDQWLRLDPKTPVTGLAVALPKVVLPVGAGAIGLATESEWWIALFAIPATLLIAAVVGLLPWLTTRYRVSSTHLEVRAGLLFRTTKTARIDRVRSVDAEATLVHRLLGLVRVKVGTGVDEGQITLDSLSPTATEALRRALLATDRLPAHAAGPDAPAAPLDSGAPSPETTPAAPGTPARLLATFDLSWIRFAPLNLVHLGVVLGATGAVLSQADSLVGSIARSDAVSTLAHAGVVVVIVVLAISALVSWSISACLAYLLRWFNLRLVREANKHGGTSLTQTAGLLTTRSVTVDEAKVRGVQVRRQLLVAAAGGSELLVLTQGLEQNSPALLPAAPHRVTSVVAADVLGSQTPLTAPMNRHGRRVFWRYLRYGMWETLAAIIIGVVATISLDLAEIDWPVWATALIVTVVGIAAISYRWESYRQRSHALTAHHVVSHAGALTRTRTMLEIDGIVGWTVKQNPFDRRLGLADLHATTAAGDEVVVIADLPVEVAVALAHQATPQLVSSFKTP